MIWALLEITLPLCLAFLFGLGGGWLFWRWRRRSISQAEWSKRTKSSEDAAALNVASLKQEHANSELQSKILKLESELGQKNGELLDSKKRQQQLNNQLQSASANSAVAATQQAGADNNDIAALQSKLAQANSEKADLDKRVQEATSRAEQQTRLANELQQKLKQSESVASERDTTMARIKELEQKQSSGNLDQNELAQTRSQLATVEQKFKNFQASVVANRETFEKEKAELQNRNTQLQAELDKQDQGASSAGDNSNAANNSNPGADRQQANQLTRQNSELYRQLQQAKGENKELAETRAKLAQITTQLNNARARNNQLVASVENKDAKASAPVTPISVGQLKKLQAEIDEKDKLIEKLQKKTKSKSNSKKSNNKSNNKQPSKTAWQTTVQTKIGTPGCDHKDDLTAINGIGPKIQKVLNRLGIKSWEQLATLKAAEIKVLDEALVDFSGRIKRDEWVPQAKAIMRNGHQPVGSKASKTTTKKPAKTPKKKSAKKAWQKGKTRFGTPGSAHRDDLKVINGIGPVIEKSLNRYGVKSWEQLAALKVKEIKTIDEALDFPGRIAREQWVQQAKALVKQFPDQKERPTRRTFLNQAAAR